MGELRTWEVGNPLPLPADVEVWAEIDRGDDEPTGVYLHRAAGDWAWSESAAWFRDHAGHGDEAAALDVLDHEDFYLRESVAKPITAESVWTAAEHAVREPVHDDVATNVAVAVLRHLADMQAGDVGRLRAVADELDGEG